MVTIIKHLRSVDPSPVRSPNQLYKDYLTDRGISLEAAENAGLRLVEDASMAHPSYRRGPAILLTYTDASGEPILIQASDGQEWPMTRVRYLTPQNDASGKPLRFSQPPGSGVHVFFPQIRKYPDWAEIEQDVSEGIVITEGEVKALAAGLEGIPTIALGGVWNFTDTDSKCLLPALERLARGGREFIIVFDSDIAEKPSVDAAMRRLSMELTRAGAKVHIANLPHAEDGSKQGLDDYIVAHGADALVDLLNAATPAAARNVFTVNVAAKNLLENLDILDEAFTASDLQVYERSGRMVHVSGEHKGGLDDGVRRAAEAPTIRDVSVPQCQQLAMRAARFEKWSGTPPKPHACECPASLAQHYLEKADGRKLPQLKAVVQAPTLSTDGSVIQDSGYHARDCVLFLPSETFPEVPDKPSRYDATAALEQLRHIVRGFEFDSPEAESVWLAAAITAVVRSALRTAPLFAFSAPVMGAGKTLAADLISIVANGREPAVMSQGRNPDEDRKRYLSVLLRGDPIVQIDNVELPIEGDALCSILTSPVWQERILGRSETVSVPTNVTWLATGNNLSFKGDMSTRALMCRIMPNAERPEERAFSWDARRETRELRPQLVVAALTLVRAYIAAGAPKQITKPYGRFEDFDRLVRHPLVWAGAADPCATRALIEREDPARETLGRFILLWDRVFGRRDVRVKEFDALAQSQVLGIATEAAREKGQAGRELYDLVCEVTGCRAGELSSRKLGMWLSRHQDRRSGGLRLSRAEDKKAKVAVWRLV